MCYQMSLLSPPPPPSTLQAATTLSSRPTSSLANGYHPISNIFTSSLLLKENTNIYDANNQYRLDILQSKATNNDKGRDMMNSDSSSIYNNYRSSTTSKDKDIDKVYCYSTEISSTGHFDIICSETKREELDATPFEALKSSIINRAHHFTAIIDRRITDFERLLKKYQYILLDNFHKMKLKIKEEMRSSVNKA